MIGEDVDIPRLEALKEYWYQKASKEVEEESNSMSLLDMFPGKVVSHE